MVILIAFLKYNGGKKAFRRLTRRDIDKIYDVVVVVIIVLLLSMLCCCQCCVAVNVVLLSMSAAPQLTRGSTCR